MAEEPVLQNGGANGAVLEEQHTDVVSPPPSSTHPLKQRRASVFSNIDKDAEEMVISSLRAQIQDLISQVSQLNSKLVKSYDRVSDLEDDLHVVNATNRSASLKISQLELERTQHLSALNTGLLVERTHVTAELTRLMEKATEEAAQRGQAESARLAIEKDLDDLSASLFGQANSMVAEARFERHLSERKVEDAERALKTAEEAVQLMQSQMQTMQAEKEEAEKKTEDMQVIMGKGKWIDKRDTDTVSLRLLNLHSPYQEYIAFLTHLRVLHPASPSSPAMSTLLQLPFLARLLTEDSEPTVRLDLAPSLNWLSRRSVLSAIHSGQLMIEPMTSATLFAESSSTATTIAGMNSSNDNISCALCGAPIFPSSDQHHHPTRPPVHPLSHSTHSNSSSSWSNTLFKKAYPAGNLSPTHSQRSSYSSNTQVFIFRLVSQPASAIASLPIPSLTKTSSQSGSSITTSYASSSINLNLHSQSTSPSSNSQPTTIYPLCMSGWCLTRLRTTCTLWAFVRTSIVDKIWEEELPPPPPPTSIQVDKNGPKPPIPPRKRGLWGIASAIGERAVSWSESDKKRTSLSSSMASLPLSNSTSSVPLAVNEQKLPPASIAQQAATNPPPPPLPRRNQDRPSAPSTDHTTTPQPHSSSSAPRTSSDLPPVPPSPIRDAHLQAPAPPSSSGSPTPPIPPRVNTPSNVPLPDSRPATPAHQGGPPPPRVASPGAPSLGGAAAPPPIPRRAAARTRGSIPAPNGTNPGTPAPSVDIAAAATKVEGEEGEKSKDSTKVDEISEQTKLDTANPGAKEEASSNGLKLAAGLSPLNRSIATSPGSDMFVDALENGEHDKPSEELAPVKVEGETNVTIEDDKKEKEEKEKVKENVVDGPVDESGPILVNGVTKDKDGSSSTKPAPLVNGHTDVDPAAVHLNGTATEETETEEEAKKKEKENLEPESKKKEREEGSYVGDVSWEERTWKELVRLREDMFWARIGGIRE